MIKISNGAIRHIFSIAKTHHFIKFFPSQIKFKLDKAYASSKGKRQVWMKGLQIDDMDEAKDLCLLF